MNRTLPLVIALAGGAFVFFLWRQQQARATIAGPVQTESGWRYPTGSTAGPTATTWRDPGGAVLFRPDYEGPVDFT